MMKNALLTLIFLVAFGKIYAQKVNPEIKAGTVLNATAQTSGQDYPLILTIKSIKSPVSISWSVDGYGDGWFVMSDKAVDSAARMLEVNQPSIGETKLSDAETFALISRVAFKNLVETKVLNYNDMKFKAVTNNENQIKINGSLVDAYHVINEKGDLELWILNNPVLPLILKSKGLITDVIINDIK